MRIWVGITALVCAATVIASAQPQRSAPARSLVRLSTASDAALAAALREAGFEVLDDDCTPGVHAVVTAAQGRALEAMGLTPVFVAREGSLRPRPAAAPGPDGPPGYPDLASITGTLSDTAAAFPAICRVVDLTAHYTAPLTHEGRHILAVKVSDHVEQDEDEHAVLLVGLHHAREIVTPVIALEALERLTTGYGVDPVITAIVDSSEIWIAPVWNPDGYEYVFNVNSLWRKNRRDNGDGTFGVDLNRNYPFAWNAFCGGSVATGSETYRGPAPASEPETQTMMALSADRHFAKVADFHSAAREVRYAYGTCVQHPWFSFLHSQAAALAAPSGYFPAPSCCTGGDIHLHQSTVGSQAFLWETHTQFQPPYASAQLEADLVWNGVRLLLERPIPLWGRVTAAGSGQPIQAEVRLLGVAFTNGEINTCEARFGRYHFFPPPAAYVVRFTAPGYIGQEHPVILAPGASMALDVQLQAECYPDCNTDGSLTVADFGCFQTKFVAQNLYADCNADGALTVADFGCFQTKFVTGCP